MAKPFRILNDPVQQTVKIYSALQLRFCSQFLEFENWACQLDSYFNELNKNDWNIFVINQIIILAYRIDCKYLACISTDGSSSSNSSTTCKFVDCVAMKSSSPLDSLPDTPASSSMKLNLRLGFRFVFVLFGVRFTSGCCHWNKNNSSESNSCG